MRKVRSWLMRAGAVLLFASAGGCFPTLLLVPLPMPAWVGERMEEKYTGKNDYRTPIMPPIAPGSPPPTCEDPPSEREILRAMPRMTRGVPYVYEEFRDNIRIVTERIVDKIDPARFFPLVGPAQLHHCHWKCTIYYTELTESSYPFPFHVKKERTEVIYIDKDHLHLYPCATPEVQQSFTRDLINN